MAGGRQYFDAVSVGGRNVVTPFAIVRPAEPANDPTNSVYTNWTDAYAALAAVEAPLKTIYIDSAGVAVVIPAGAWNMAGVAIVGFQAANLGPLGRQLIVTADGCSFTGWTEGCENCSLVHNGAAPLFTSNIAALNIFTMRTGRNAIWASSGAGGVVMLDGTGGLRLVIEENALILGDTPGFNPVLRMTNAGGEYALLCLPGFGITDQSLEGPVGTTINVFVGGPFDSEFEYNQPAFLGTLGVSGGADQLLWPLGPTNGDFVAPGPAFVGDALTRIAAAVRGLLGGDIP